MAIRITLQDEPDCGLLGTGLFYTVVDPRDFDKEYDLRETFGVGLLAAFQPGLVGEGLLTDPNNALIFLVRNGKLKLIAGVHGVPGYRDGAGSQALFGKGGFQNSHYAWGQLPDKSFLVTDSKNGKIRQLKEGAGGRWTVSTYMPFGSDAMTLDGFGNIWSCDFYGQALTKILPDKTIVKYGVPSNINQAVALKNGNLLLQSRNNAWDQTFRFYAATGQYELLCGSDHDTGRVDGAAIGEASFHTVQIAWANDDGSKIWFGSGDELQVREYDEAAGQVRTMFVDGTWRRSTVRLTAPHSNTDPNLPLWIDATAGRQANGLPWTSIMPWKPAGGYRWYKKAVAVEVADPPPGANVNNGWLDGVDNAGARGWVIIGTNATVNATVNFIIDGQAAGSMVTDGPCQPCIDAHKSLGGGTATVTPWFVWPIPAKYRDGKPHLIKAVASGFTLLNPNNEPKEISFTLQPSTQPDPGGTMKNVLVTITTQDTAVPNADKADHFVFTLDGVSANEPLSTKAHTFVGKAPGNYSGNVACADAAGNLLAPAVVFSVTVPTDPTAPIPVSVLVTLG